MKFSSDEHYGVQWLAGLFEGEGCISISYTNKNPDHKIVSLQRGSLDRDVIDTLYRLVGVGKIAEKPIKNNKVFHEWRTANKPDVYKILLRIRRHLHTRRRAKCDAALEILMKDKRVIELMT